MAILDAPRGVADERVIEVVQLHRTYECPACLSLQRWNASLLHRISSIAKALQQLLDIQLGQWHLLVMAPQRTGRGVLQPG